MAEQIEPEELKKRIDSDSKFRLIDTRPKEDFAKWHINGAINFPYTPEEKLTNTSLDNFKETADVTRDDQIITICAKGIISAKLADQLTKNGFRRVKAVAGGMEAWSGVYDHVPIATISRDLLLLQLQRRAKGCLGYLVGSKRAGEAAVVDVSRYTNQFLDTANERGLKITHVFDTHIHADHISGGRELAQKLGVDYCLGDMVHKRKPEFDYHPIGANEVITIGNISIKAVHTPGHTTEMTSWLIEDEALISGDSLFANSIGRTELEFQKEAKKGARLQYQSLIGKLLSLPDTVKVLPGHFTITTEGDFHGVTPGRPIFSTIGHLRKSNKALQMSEKEFIRYISKNVPEKPPNYEEIIAINLGKHKRISKQKEIELEMGPNRCAATEQSMVN